MELLLSDHTFLCEQMGRREIFHTFLRLVEIEGHFTQEFATYTQSWALTLQVAVIRYLLLSE
jgi:hypothetical protein